ncbi:hypothetical protein HPB52_004172 [Rhipicephalus sanguineus]|uniref:Protein kinase domain-containing protein n=1 Tax=Rhipicephalus sanguineus TaxID=34632 RepID=A0A9D4T2U7_RHISA|nr:hypothetical protein HPB52_004172 [Rhipicephalus sanguineus]
MAGGAAQQQRRCSLSKLRGTALCAFSFGSWGSGSGAGGVLGPPELQPSHGGSTNLLSGSWVFYSGGAPSSPVASLLQPGKAVVTVDASTTQILTANKAACALLGVLSTQVSSRRLSEFLAMKKGQYALTEADVDAAGEVVVIAGKVMDLIDSDGKVVPVSVWVRKLESDSEPRCLVVMEPVQRTTAVVTFDSAKGQILTADKSLAALCGYSDGAELEGTLITDIIPSLVLPTCEDGVVKLVRKQQATGRTRDGSTFPLSILLEPVSSDDQGDSSVCNSQAATTTADSSPVAPVASVYRGVVWVFANISGMITVLPDGSIHSCNTNFSLMLFGYTQNQLQGKHITVVIPTFYDDFEYLDTDSVPLPPLDDDEEDSRACAFLDERPDSDTTELCRPLNPLGKPFSPRGGGQRRGHGGSRSSSVTGDDLPLRLQDLSMTGSVIGSVSGRSLGGFQRSTSAAEPLAPVLGPSGEGQASSASGDLNGNNVASSSVDSPRRIPGTRLKVSTCRENCEAKLPTSDSFHSTSTMTSSTMYSSEENTQEASFRRHDSHPSTASGADGDEAANERAFQAELKTFRSCDSLLSIAEGSYTGLGRHRDGSHIAIVYQIRRVDLEEGSSIYCLWVSRDLEVDSCPPHSDTEASREDTSDHTERKGTALHDETAESEYTSGLYAEHYTTLQQIGKGAYGCVKMAYRNSDRLLVITKFIRKSKVYEESWVHDQMMGRVVPLEVSLLTTLSHPNIVRVLDVFENSSHFQMLWSRQVGLFFFVSRPQIKFFPILFLPCQVVSALSYLHGLHILHRDVKDENIIMDERFNVKLIDFGSAAFMAPDRHFTTFCGTVEYCSPEVLQGNPYAGPELEMWALGVTLYTLIFGENPFFDVEETIAAMLKPPYATSRDLWELISRLLHPEPHQRCTLAEAEHHPWTTQPVCPESYRFEDVVHATPEEISPSKYFHQDSSIYFSCSLYDLSKSDGPSSRHRSLSCASSVTGHAHSRCSSSHEQATASAAAPPPSMISLAGPCEKAGTVVASEAAAYSTEDISRELEACS